MRHPSYLSALHAEYRYLASVDPATLTADQRRSLIYFRKDTNPNTRAVDPDAPKDQVGRWVCRAHAVDAFVLDRQRAPRRNNRRTTLPVASDEQQLAIWIEEQRRPVTRARLCSYQRRRIDALPGLDTRPREERWWATLIAYEQFLHAYHRAPAARKSDTAERMLALWATRQRRAYHAGRISEERARALQALSIWGWGAR